MTGRANIGARGRVVGRANIGARGRVIGRANIDARGAATGRANIGPRGRVIGLALAIACAHVGVARAERPVHGSVGVGSSLLWTGHDDNRFRFEIELDIEPASRYGGFVAWRGFDDIHHGMLLGGLIYEAGAARPRLVVDLHADIGADLDQRAPVAGGGIRTTLTIYGPLGAALDSGAYLVIDGVDDTRLRFMGSTSLVVRW